VKYKNTDVCQKQERELDEIISIPYYSLNANCGMPNAKCGIPLQYLPIVIRIIEPERIYDVKKEQEDECENGKEPCSEGWG